MTNKTENKYRTALQTRVREEKEREQKQLFLKEKYGVSGDVEIREPGAAGVFAGVFRFLLTAVSALLAFVFLVVLLDPETRRMFFEMPLFHLFSKG